MSQPLDSIGFILRLHETDRCRNVTGPGFSTWISALRTAHRYGGPLGGQL